MNLEITVKVFIPVTYFANIRGLKIFGSDKAINFAYLRNKNKSCARSSVNFLPVLGKSAT